MAGWQRVGARATAALLAAWPFASAAQSDVRAVPTYESVGLYWSAPGADPATGCTVRYHRTGESAWHAGLDLWFDASTNECRGSLVQLAPGTSYDVQLGLPGQPALRSLSFATWSNQKPVASTIVVTGGSATLDVTQGGSPSGYVVYQAAQGAVLDAANASPFNITVNASYVVIRGFTLRGAGQDAIRLGPAVTDVIIEDNDISGWGRQRSADLGMDLDAAVRAVCTSNALERITIQRNRIHDPRYGANSWSQGHPEGPQAVSFSHCGGNHVIRHNEIWSSAGHYYNDVIGGEDNISTAGFPNYDSDIYGNKLSNAWDDGIEAEGGDRNVRVWGNYIDSTATGIATALASVGPFYAFRNVYNRNRELDNVPLDSDLRQEIFKAGSAPGFADGRRYFFHNTTLQAVDPGATKTLGVQYGISGAGADEPFNNAVSRNNIYHTWDPSQPLHRQVGTGNEFTSDMYNGVANVPVTSGIHAAPAYAPGNGWQSGDGGAYALQPGTPGFDAGVLIPNFNDDYLGQGPDVGAAESGAPLMKFGVAASPGPAIPPPKASPSMTLIASPNPSRAGSSVTLAATVSGSAGAATGNVTFNDSGSPIPGCTTVPVASDGSVSCSTSGFAQGTHPITASYSGDATYNPATSPPYNETVQDATSGETNFASVSHGGLAITSSQLSANYPVQSLNNGDHTGASWSLYGGWADATPGTFPDWAEIDFDGPKLIDHVVVYTLQDNWQDPVEPSDTLTFTQYGITDFTVEAWTGTAWTALAAVSGNNLVKRTVTFAPFNTTKIRVKVTGALADFSRIVEIEAWGVAGSATGPALTNVALASSGATAIASSSAGAGFPPSGAIDGNKSSVSWTRGVGWADGTVDAYPDWLEIDFDATYRLDHLIVYTLPDDWDSTGPAGPYDYETFTRYGLVDFTVQGWDGSQWVNLATVTGNNLVKRIVPFERAFDTSKIRLVVTKALGGLARVIELEAWGTRAPTQQLVNMALASKGGVASASSQLNGDYPIAAINNGEVAGVGWSTGGGWADGTVDAFPDWVEIDFTDPASLTSVVVYTVQDNWQNPSTPTDSMTFTQYGVTDFTVQGWDGTQWVTLGSVAGNDKVKRIVTFAAFTTSRIRVNVTHALASLSRIVEVEAWGTPVQPSGSNVALAANGAVATASSTYDATYFPVAAVNDGDRKGVTHESGNGGWWADGTQDTYPDWVEIAFSGPKSLDRVTVYTVQDDAFAPVEPVDGMTFTRYGITDFQVQAWDGTQWQDIGVATSNNLVKRSFAVSVTTTKIRVLVTRAMASLSRITEIEAFGS